MLQSKGASRRPTVTQGALEPAMGAGVFLREGLARGLDASTLVGVDVDPTLGPQWEVLSQAHPALRLVRSDALLPHPVLEGPFDVVIGNPPYGSAGLEAIATPETDEALALAQAVREDYDIHRKPGAPLRPERLHSFPIECLFVERCLRLCAEGGFVALVLPEGLLSNQRLQHVRDWVERHGTVRVVVSLPPGTFRTEGATARTALVVIEKAQSHEPAILFEAPRATAYPGILDALEAKLRGAEASVALAPSLLGQRWDPRFWSPSVARPLDAIEERYSFAPLGDFLAFMTYGPIVTGRQREVSPGEVVILNQAELGFSGLEWYRAQRVAADSPYDPPRSRPQPGDLLFARSGAGSLGKGRMAVLEEAIRANVGCFVDILRFDGLDPHFAWLYLASRFGQGQIRRLINGVATPNLSFKELRSLRVPVLPPDRQEALARLYRVSVRPLHRALQEAAADPLRRKAAEQAMREAIATFEHRLAHETAE